MHARWVLAYWCGALRVQKVLAQEQREQRCSPKNEKFLSSPLIDMCMRRGRPPEQKIMLQSSDEELIGIFHHFPRLLPELKPTQSMPNITHFSLRNMSCICNLVPTKHVTQCVVIPVRTTDASACLHAYAIRGTRDVMLARCRAFCVQKISPQEQTYSPQNEKILTLHGNATRGPREV